ncbi:MAG: ribonuclease, partial [Polaromonas sp.]|nr:ribonuclease [Polaromonas sp.]
ALFPGWETLLYLINIVLSVSIATVLFAMIFKVMPQARIGWSDVWVGAGVTAVLFEVGKWLISLYIGNSSVTSSFAAAGSLVVLLVWVYYSAQIFLLGAEFTWVYANDHGTLAKPDQAGLPAAKTPGANSAGPAGQATAGISGVAQPPPAPVIHPTPAVASMADKPAALAEPGHATLKQRAIVYGSSAAAFLALRQLLKRKS